MFPVSLWFSQFYSLCVRPFGHRTREHVLGCGDHGVQRWQGRPPPRTQVSRQSCLRVLMSVVSMGGPVLGDICNLSFVVSWCVAVVVGWICTEHHVLRRLQIYFKADKIHDRPCGSGPHRLSTTHADAHLPYQPWCSAYVEGRGRDDLHRRRAHKDEDALPVISFDDGLGGDETGALRAMFGLDTCSGATCAAMMARKGQRDLVLRASSAWLRRHCFASGWRARHTRRNMVCTK